MKAVIFKRHGGPETLEYAEVPDPVVGPGQALIRVKACSVNRLDLWIRQGLPAYHTQLPHISGCDVAGVVERVGVEVSGLKAGARVVLAPGLSCGHCTWCQVGQDSHCPSFVIRGASIPGGYAEIAVAETQDVIPIPQHLSTRPRSVDPLETWLR